uniref:response regulator n=1 Tax=Ningiella ruwaisensis TaxID=2364274 RepID=UPI0010A0A9B5|nr:response regulator [Ningiella ruwaisensis]
MLDLDENTGLDATAHKHRILLVDDSPNELRILMEVLKHKYAIVVATSGEQAINMVQEDKDIELVLLDVNMPLKDGYQTCADILKISPEMPVVFVSANDSTEEILKGFDVGGVDYLTKPIDTNVVARKVDVIVHDRELLHRLQDENKSTSDMVMSVIASAGHLGTVLGFLRSGLKIKTHDGLISALFDVFDSLNMDVCVQLKTPQGTIYRSSRSSRSSCSTHNDNANITPLEEDLLERASRMQGRFLERGSRYIVNFESVAIIVKNMPTDDENLRGDLRDNLMMILEDTDALNKKLSSDSKAAVSTHHPARQGSLETTQIKEMLQDIVSTMHMLSKQYKVDKASVVNLIEDLNSEFENAFFKLGLLEQQEDELTSIIASKTEQFNMYMDKSLDTEEAIFSIEEQLEVLLSKL